MHGLSEIIAMNARPVRVEDNHNRQCSWTGDKSGIVLHSAKLRNTAFLPPARAKLFLLRIAERSTVAARNKLIESYFE